MSKNTRHNFPEVQFQANQMTATVVCKDCGITAKKMKFTGEYSFYNNDGMMDEPNCTKSMNDKKKPPKTNHTFPDIIWKGPEHTVQTIHCKKCGVTARIARYSSEFIYYDTDGKEFKRQPKCGNKAQLKEIKKQQKLEKNNGVVKYNHKFDKKEVPVGQASVKEICLYCGQERMRYRGGGCGYIQENGSIYGHSPKGCRREYNSHPKPEENKPTIHIEENELPLKIITSNAEYPTVLEFIEDEKINVEEKEIDLTGDDVKTLLSYLLNGIEKLYEYVVVKQKKSEIRRPLADFLYSYQFIQLVKDIEKENVIEKIEENIVNVDKIIEKEIIVEREVIKEIVRNVFVNPKQVMDFDTFKKSSLYPIYLKMVGSGEDLVNEVTLKRLYSHIYEQVLNKG